MAAIMDNPCEYCGRKYVLRSGLTKHLRLCHPLGNRVVRMPIIEKKTNDPLITFGEDELRYFSNEELEGRRAALAAQGEKLEYEKERIRNRIFELKQFHKEHVYIGEHLRDLQNELDSNTEKRRANTNEITKIIDTVKWLKDFIRYRDAHGIPMVRCYSNMSLHYLRMMFNN